VNSIDFNSTGNLMLSSSNDKKAILWDFNTQKINF